MLVALDIGCRLLNNSLIPVLCRVNRRFTTPNLGGEAAGIQHGISADDISNVNPNKDFAPFDVSSYKTAWGFLRCVPSSL